MREKHPIDERFRQVLYNGEADPPEVVRAALGAHLNWTTAPRASRGWWPVVIVAVGLISTGAALWAWQNDPRSSVVGGEHRIAEHAAEDIGVPANEATAPGPSIAVTSTATREQETGPTAQTNNAAGDRQDAAMGAGAQEIRTGPDKTHRNNAMGDPANSSGPVGTNAEEGIALKSDKQERPETRMDGKAQRNTTTTPARPGDNDLAAATVAKVTASGHVPLSGTPEPPAPITGSDRLAFAEDLRSIPIDPLRIAPEALVPSGTPVSRGPSPNYVLPSGAWWVGASVSFGNVQGTWKGTDAAALQEAENWQSTMQGGLLVGHEWRSGWGFSTGLGIARVRSTFQYEDELEGSSVLEVDTTWMPTMHSSGDILFSWQIDSLIEEVPGGVVRRDARNLYTAIQVPLLLHWHAEARRLRYGAFGGFNVWIPTQRKGLTLVNSLHDAPPTALALQDPQVDERFSSQVHGLAGISVGYTINEQLSAYVEPMISVPLISFDTDNTPWLTRPLLQFRVQYELRSNGH
ncbi:MAG: hypothetical protein JNL43_10500 [Flavobacteriales bacterium]|nr:hypothetical protein [Flavobacteriales bacterium]